MSGGIFGNFFTGQNNNPGSNPSTVGTPSPDADPLIQNIEGLNIRYNEKIDEINRNVQSHIGTLGGIKNKINGIMQKANEDCQRKIQKIMEDHQGENEGSRKEKERLERDLDAIKTKYDNASQKINELVNNVNSNKSLVNLQKSVEKAKELGNEIMSSDQSGQSGQSGQSRQTGGQTDDFNYSFDVSRIGYLDNETASGYGRRVLDEYFKMFPNSAFKDSRVNNALHLKIASERQLNEGDLDRYMLNYNEDVKDVIRNLRSKLVTRYQQPPFNKQIQRGGYISTKKRRRANRHSKNFFRFSRKLPNNKSKPKRKRK